MLEMVVGGVCAYGATNLFRCGQYPLLEGLLAGVRAHGELQELVVGRGGLRDACPKQDLASGIPVRNEIRTRGSQLGKLIALKFLEFEITN